MEIIENNIGLVFNELISITTIFDKVIKPRKQPDPP